MNSDISETIKLAQALARHGKEIGEALKDIRDNRLYREEFADFDSYCAERWHMLPDEAEYFIALASTSNEDDRT